MVEGQAFQRRDRRETRQDLQQIIEGNHYRRENRRGDPSGNPRLRSAIQAARAQSMPNDNVERAIKRGTGEGSEAQHFEEIIYEGYGPGGVAVIVEAATDNKNRTAAEIRSIFTKNNGNLASTGSVSYMFHRKGQITVPRGSHR